MCDLATAEGADVFRVDCAAAFGLNGSMDLSVCISKCAELRLYVWEA